MSNLKFYIYGVPDGFNMLSGMPDEILYFQLFYDTNRKGTELRINRKANGETVYSYLKYNLVACKGREGAFLGMSVVFPDNSFCNNPTALKDLFDGVYNQVILKAEDKDKIISVITGGNAIGRFCISKFAERQEMCEKIGRIIINNILGELSNSISQIDGSFDNSKEGRILSLPFDADNNTINQALRSYSWVSLSTEYKPILTPTQSAQPIRQGQTRVSQSIQNQDLLSVHFIQDLSNKVTPYKDFIIQGLKGMKSASDISKKREEINRYLDTIEEYVAKQPNELSKLKEDYLSIYNDIIGLTPQKILNPYTGPIKDGGKKETPGENDWVKAIKPYIPKILVAILALLVTALCLTLWPHGEETQANTGGIDTTAITEEPGIDAPPIPFDDATFSSLISNCDFTAAWNMLQQLEDGDKKNNLIRTLLNAYKGWLRMDLNMKENDLDKLLELRHKLQEYSAFNDEYESDIQLLEEGYIKPLQEKQAKAVRDRKARELANHRNQNLNSGDGREGHVAKQKVNSDGVVHIFNSDNAWKQGSAVTGSTISCKSKSHFIITGAKLAKADTGIEVAPQEDGTIRIRANNGGQYKVTLDKMTLTFNVSR